jgi:hypothetical protein
MKNCKSCRKRRCPEKCFNAHPGSMKAFKNLLNKNGYETKG